MPWTDQFSDLRDLPVEVTGRLLSESQSLAVPAGTRVFAPGRRPKGMLLLQEGSVRVQQSSPTGRDVFLYRVHAGESCILTAACLLADEAYSAEAIAETDAKAVAIPRELFDELLGCSPAFRHFVFQGYARRIADLFDLIEDIVFQRVDVRLSVRLLELAAENRVETTHQALAVDLGTAREVVSRVLGEFQRRGWVETGRGEVAILAPEALKRLARSVT